MTAFRMTKIGVTFSNHNLYNNLSRGKCFFYIVSHTFSESLIRSHATASCATSACFIWPFCQIRQKGVREKGVRDWKGLVWVEERIAGGESSACCMATTTYRLHGLIR